MKILSTKSFKQAMNCNPYTSAILRYNNIDLKNIPYFFPDKNRVYEPEHFLYLMKPIDKGQEFVEFIKNNKDKRYCIIGDYDCDGIMATVIMCQTLAMLGITSTYIIPDRFNDGYGMKKQHVDYAIQSGCEVIITVDNGITTNEVIDYAHENNLIVLVTDHHKPKGPNNGDIVIDPLYNNDEFKGISGATVALKLSYLLFKEFDLYVQNKDLVNDLVVLAGITAISDVMPTINENRILIKATLNHLNNKVNTSCFIRRLAILLDFYITESETEMKRFKNFNKSTIEYYFVPVINAVNRVIGNVNQLVADILELFHSESSIEEKTYSSINKQRQKMKADLEDQCQFTSDSVQVQLLPHQAFQNMSGIAGLIASYVSEEKNCPAIIGVDNLNDDGIEHFSGRSVPGFSLFNAVKNVAEKHPELYINYGGHDAALGCALKRNEIELFRKYISEEYDNSHEIKEEEYFLTEDFPKYIQVFERLAPFGNGFEFPKFYTKTKLKNVNMDYRSIVAWSMPNVFIKCYKHKDLLYLNNMKNINPNAEIELIISLTYDNFHGNTLIRLEKILDHDDYIDHLVETQLQYEINKR